MVYPRACGGTSCSLSVRVDLTGLSPRLRGNHDYRQAVLAPHRSIPAPAGEPSQPFTIETLRRVYPRACGGTSDCTSPPSDADGLSPRLRGNPPSPLPSRRSGGSIPAPAGEPTAGQRQMTGGGVYPRACGGTPPEVGAPVALGGLSPRLRGNLHRRRLWAVIVRSIPAPAGEPAPWTA